MAGFGVSGFAAADNLTHLGAQVTRARRERRGPRAGGDAARGAGRPRPARPGRDRSTLPDDVDVVVTSPGWKPDAPLLAQARPARHPGLGRGRAGLAAARPGEPGPLAVRHRHQRQDHDRPDAPRDPHRRGPAQRGGRQRRPPGDRGGDGPDAVRRPGRRALQLPAALHPVRERRGRRGAEHRRGPPRLVHRPDRDGRLRRRQGPHLRTRAAGVRLQRRRPRDRAAGARGRRGRRRPRGRLHPRHPGRRHGRRRRGPARRPGVHPRAADERGRAVRRRRPGLARPARGRQRAGRRRPGPRPRRLAGGRPRRAASLPHRRPPDRDRGRRTTTSPGSTTPRPPTRTPRSPRCRPSTPSCGSPAGWPRAPASTTW